MRQLCEGRCAADLDLFGKITEPGTEHEPDCRFVIESACLRPRFERVSESIDSIFFCVRGSGSSP